MQEAPLGRIAIVGMSGRFPGAGTVDSFWRNICSGVESIRRFEERELDDHFDQTIRSSPNYVRARPTLEDVDMFDAAFFGMQAREAALTDPQHRVFLECCWEALEDAGYDPSSCAMPVGVFAGCSMNTYFLNNVLQTRAAIEEFTTSFQVGAYSSLLGAGREFLATRVSYKLNLQGPSITVQTACSTSLVAVVQACQSLELYQCDMALAGGVSISFPQHRGYLHQEGGMVSADGHCRPFDADASGTVFGSGAGVVLLKRLEDAIAAGDTVYAVILGTGLSNDGAGKAGFTAPGVDGQVSAITQALANAQVDARSIGYVECHGTGTPLGDPIEIAALTKAFRSFTQDRHFCAVGSVKGNIGHLDAAAGVVGLIKAALIARDGHLVPSLHFKSPNPQIEFADSPFFVETGSRSWPANPLPRRAAVSSLGVGGTNAHVILEQPPVAAPALETARPDLVVLSARTSSALEAARTRLSHHLANTAARLDDVAFTLRVGRRQFQHRCAVVCTETGELVSALGSAQGERIATGEADNESPPVFFMFPGQGAQYRGMARGLYERWGVFRRELDTCAAVLRTSGIDLLAALYPPGGTEDPTLAATAIAQPAMFAVEYALARLWESWGVAAAGYVGHSVGEFVAACLAGVFTLEDAVEIIAARGRLMDALPAGGMTAVRLAEKDLGPLLERGLSLAAVNGPTSCVVAGPFDALKEAEAVLAERGTLFRRLATSHAFHSAMMDPAIAPLEEAIARKPRHAPARRWVSCVTGEWITPDEAISAGYWARHLREPVRFAPAVETLLRDAAPLLLEVGPGNTLSALAQQAGRMSSGRVVASLPDRSRAVSDEEAALSAAAKLWVAGVKVDLQAVSGTQGNRISLPTYPFERRRHWIDPPARSETAPRSAGPPAASLRAEDDACDLVSGKSDMPQAAFRDPADLRTSAIERAIVQILGDVSGEAFDVESVRHTNFLELGFDSLLLTQVAQQLQRRFSVKLAFRQLLGSLSTVRAVAEFLNAESPLAASFAALADAPADAGDGKTSPEASPRVPATAGAEARSANSSAAVAELMRAQLAAMSDLMRQQLEALGGVAGASVPTPENAAQAHSGARPVASDAPAEPVREETGQRPSRFQVYRPGARSDAAETGARVLDHISDLTRRMTTKTAGSKRLTASARPHLADPRAAAGFRPEWKELVYPIVSARSKGARIWDVDGNEYIDLVNGYGPSAFGHSPDFVTEALREQLDKGFAIGPQAELAGEVSSLFADITGNERMTFCNTGSEAVMAALRVARTVTGRSKVVMFEGAYHGQFDEVLVKGTRRAGGQPRSVPIAAGIPASAVENMIVLEYGDPQSLEWIREHVGELAAVIVEPVQSRHPALLPVAFLTALREITEASGTAFIMDEIVTGFRVHPGGMQAVTGIRADLATYGKVVGGGLPIGILAGKARFMDALDGGCWNYGDASEPEAQVTFFAGTFVRHPLALAAVRAVLKKVQEQGLQPSQHATRLAERLARSLDRLFRAHSLKARPEQYSSIVYFSLFADSPLSPLLFHHLRYRGIYVQEGFPLFLTSAHTDADVIAIEAALADSLEDLARAGIVSPAGLHASGSETGSADAAGEAIPPTESQTEIWLAAQAGEDASCAFNESVTLRLRGQLDREAFGKALELVVNRHDALRLRFAEAGESMAVAQPIAFPLGDEEPGPDAERRLSDHIGQDARTPFDLTNGPPIRARLFRLADDEHALVLTAHHIVCDGWSMNVLAREIADAYAALSRGARAELPPALQFSAYARSEGDSEVRRSDVRYWTDLLADSPPLIDLPTDRPRTAHRSYAGATRSHRIGKDLYRAVKSAGARQECTLFVSLLAVFQAMMGRLADAAELVVAVPAAGQSLVEGRELVGHCVNLLPVRCGWTLETTVAQHLGAVRQSVLEAYDHQRCTLGTIVRDLRAARPVNRMPLTEIQFNLERLASGLKAADISIEVEPNPKANVVFDLFWNITESSEGLRIDCDYNAELFDAATIDRWFGYYTRMLEAFCADTGQLVVRLPMIPEPELAWLTQDLNATRRECSWPPLVHESFQRQAAARPHGQAVLFRGEFTTYGQLAGRAADISQLLSQRGVSPGSRIGILVERSPDMIASLLGVLMSGCVYVPLDPAHPPGRLKRILENAELSAVLADGSAPKLNCDPAIPFVNIAEDRADAPIHGAGAAAPASDPDAAAYVIYTSGSTGNPKGVEVSHRSVVNLLESMAEKPGFDEQGTLLAVTTISFDIAALELFLPLATGGTVVLAERRDVVDGHRLRSLVETSGASVMQATPSGWRLLLEAGFASRPGFKMLCGGEPLTRELADRLLAGGGELWNMYGPTETTIWSACAKVTREEATITIGGPIANTQLHVVDRFGQVAPCCVTGELLIGGSGVAKGYFRNEALTAAKFVQDPAGQGGRLYRTGDLARRLASGEIQVLGRSDTQVKLRGFRIELGEIEAAIAGLPEVAACAVALRDDTSGTPSLVAYVVEGSQHRPGAELRLQLVELLPDYMIPAAWVTLPALPTLPNGKLDRAALPGAPAPAAPLQTWTAPEEGLETELATIWAEVLQFPQVGRDDDLLALGADSIQLFQIAARANRRGLKLSARQLLENRTVAGVAAAISEGNASGSGAQRLRAAASVRDFVRLRQAGAAD